MHRRRQLLEHVVDLVLEAAREHLVGLVEDEVVDVRVRRPERVSLACGPGVAAPENNCTSARCPGMNDARTRNRTGRGPPVQRGCALVPGGGGSACACAPGFEGDACDAAVAVAGRA